MNFKEERKYFIYLVLIITALFSGCKNESDNDEASSQAPVANPTQPTAENELQATYCAANFIRLNFENGQYSLIVPELGSSPISMTGTFENSILQLTGEYQGFQLLYLGATTSDTNYMSTNLMLLDNGVPRHSIKSLAKAGPCETLSFDALPKIARNPVNLTDMNRISRFRSSAGHNYSDPSETCRSMKHYFEPRNNTNQTTEIYAPFRAVVVAVYNDDGPVGDNEINNQHITLQPVDYPAVQLAIFHTELAGPLTIGSIVEAGALLGWADLNRNGQISSDFDFAVHINTEAGFRAISIFDIMTDDTFNEYSVWSGLNSRDDFKISKSDRDANPLQCGNEGLSSFSGEFTNRDADSLIGSRWVEGL